MVALFWAHEFASFRYFEEHDALVSEGQLACNRENEIDKMRQYQGVDFVLQLASALAVVPQCNL